MKKAPSSMEAFDRQKGSYTHNTQLEFYQIDKRLRKLGLRPRSFKTTDRGATLSYEIDNYGAGEFYPVVIVTTGRKNRLNIKVPFSIETPTLVMLEHYLELSDRNPEPETKP